MMDDGIELNISAQDIYSEENIHTVDIPGVGELDAIYNRDAVVFAEKFGIEKTVKSTGRYTLRWPGFAPIIHTWISLGMFSKEPLEWLSNKMSPQDYLCKLLEPQLQLGEKERDVCILRLDVKGIRNGKPDRLIYHVIDYRDLETGFTAMNRTVGFPASIATQMILNDEITERGLLSPIHDIPFESFIAELEKRGIQVTQSG
jgi:saccharopine dehydrogenase-like NADP-dependent oxidoreductase